MLPSIILTFVFSINVPANPNGSNAQHEGMDMRKLIATWWSSEDFAS